MFRVITISVVFCLHAACTNDAKRTSSNTAFAQQSNGSLLFTLKENSIQNVKLPLPHKEVLPDLRESFKPYSVVKELGQFEYGAAPVYEVIDQENPIVLFEMEMTDTLKLKNLYLRKYVKDQYGLQIGDKVGKIKELRGDSIQHNMDFHQHTYLIVPNSNILYEIIGEFSEDINLSNPSITTEEIENWKIEAIIWREYPNKN